MKNLKSFGITLAVSLVILAIAALFACGFVADTVCGIFSGGGKDLDQILTPGETTAPTDDGSERFTKKLNGQSFTWLWVVADYRPEVFDNYYPTKTSQIDGMKDFGILGAEYKFVEATDIVLVHADVDKRDYTVMTVPAAAKVETPAGEITLGRVYAYYGAAGLAEKVSALTGLSVEDYSVIHSTDLGKLADAIGSIPMTLPVDIYTDGKNYISAPAETTGEDSTDADAKDTKETKKPKDDEDTTADADETTIENELDRSSSVSLAKKLMPALLYYDPSDGIDTEMTILQSFATGVFSNISSFSDKDMQNVLSRLSGVFVSNTVTGDDVVLCGETVRAYTWLDIKVMTYPGKFISQRGSTPAYFKPDVNSGVAYFYDYR